LPNYDEKKVHFGFLLAGNFTTFKVRHSDYFASKYDTLKSMSPKGSGGFTLGFVTNFRMSELWDFRINPSVGFYQRGVDYNFKNELDAQTIEATFIEMPLLVKFKSHRRKNARTYLIAGLKPAISTNSKNKDERVDKLRTKNTDLAIDYGVGFDLYYPLFKFSPEIRFSHGLKNMLIKDNNIFSNSISKMTTHTITLFLNFE
jgi:hypothetical protein